MSQFVGFGSGKDGIIPSSGTYSSKASPCTGTAGSTTLTISSSGFTAFDTVLIIQTVGTYANAGNWELNTVISDNGSTLTLAAALDNTYTSGAQVIEIKEYSGGTVSGTLAVPQFASSLYGVLPIMASGGLYISGALNGSALGFPDDYNPSLTEGGGNGLSYDGANGTGGRRQQSPETYVAGTYGGGNASNTTESNGTRSGGGGGGTYYSSTWGQGDEGAGGGGGAGHATAGGGGGGGGDSGTGGGAGGATTTNTALRGGYGGDTQQAGSAPAAGTASLTGNGGNGSSSWDVGTGGGGGGGVSPDTSTGTRILPGSAGGQGGNYLGSQPGAGYYGGTGGHGGGIIMVFAPIIYISGTCYSVGGNGADGLTWTAGSGGGGSGGFVYLCGKQVTIGTDKVRVNGGTGYPVGQSSGGGGNGGHGRIVIKACSLSGSVSSSYYGTLSSTEGGHNFCGSVAAIMGG